MRAVAGTGAGFLLAVLWFDLMFDVQARRHPRDNVPAGVRASISAYYARVTTAARPMSYLVALVMLSTIAAIGAEIARSELPAAREGASLVLTAGAVWLAGVRTVPNAVRLGRATDDPTTQSRLAHRIRRDHIVCFGAIAVVVALQLLPA
ncbi:MAG TPA: hypothetical protein VGP92_13960 [Acidimicrobiia bacterium]|nr:hypothetical protein [Acidimicrobiia bacterium]